MRIADVHDLESMLQYCVDKLNWQIDEDLFYDIDDITYDFDASDLGLKSEEFARIKELRQLRPIVESQPWGVFAVDFESKHLEVTALRKILSKLVPSGKGRDYKTWDYEHLLFICFWGERAYRTVGFVLFEQSDTLLPIIKPLYCSPRIEDRTVTETFEQHVRCLSWPENIDDSENWITSWSKAFHHARGAVIRNTIALTEELAQTALRIAKNLSDAFKVESTNGRIHDLYNRFNSALSITLSDHDFFSMYAQTIVFGLFSARCIRPEVAPFTAATAIECIPNTNPLLKQLLSECLTETGSLHFDELEVYELLDTINAVDIHSILSDFNRRTGMGKEDPIVYFYEDFLNIYEREQKKRSGVYYTPAPVVDFMVRSIDHLLKTSFSCSQGFLNNSVSVLDPATGTGTFLRRVIQKMHEEYVHSSVPAGWSSFVQNSLLNRIFGFEFMMAPYAVAHMKLAMVLQETGYTFASNQRLQVFLANALENELPAETFANNDPLAVESSNAVQIKDQRINVILGNPPYRTDSVNKGDWIMRLMEDYKREPGSTERLHERNPKVINDDYVKFIRFAQEVIAAQEQAIIAFVTPHSYTDNLTFRGMRWTLLNEFDEIFILDLHGNAMSREDNGSGERDENVFDIQQGVSISFFIRNRASSHGLANIHYADVFGSRSHKYDYLWRTDFSSIAWTDITPRAPMYFFKPKNIENAGAYESGISLAELFPVNIAGIKTHDDENLVSQTAFDTPCDQLYDYRPFDIRHIDYDLGKVKRHRFNVMKHFVNHENYGFVMNRQVATDNWSHVQIVTHMIDNRLHYSHEGIPVVAPLYLYNDTSREPNLDLTQVHRFELTTGMTFTKERSSQLGTFSPLDVMDYSYACLFSQEYRDKYSGSLNIDFPRIPVPSNDEHFISMCQFGARLRELHLCNVIVPNSLGIIFVGDGNNTITKMKLDGDRLFINRTQYFSNIRPDLWDFPFGGYRSLQKWFKDRKNQQLSTEDINHVIQVFNILDQTEDIMAQIDEE